MMQLTETKLLWLHHLAKADARQPEVRWEKMPRTVTGKTVSNRTWKPMAEAGLITARFGSVYCLDPLDWLFSITNAGRAAIARATGTQADSGVAG